ncbi:hypothetical protein [Halorientalis regularis]|uniref:Uncharacterized protein n=1 Tax=Halorientalis regularis TaxID=660518 RepID=A0A1G7SLQ1_9EURY|nr:hypothetical protein [Halorientalis regularis]SDG23871.1 hypothetical protein SAMN05216218_11922 [Halorientalis regularis]
MRTVEIEVLRGSEWEMLVFEDIEKLTLAGAPHEDGLLFTLTGTRDDQPNQVETGILDIAERHEPLLDTPVPRNECGTSVPQSLREE